MKFDPALLPANMRSLKRDHRGYPVPFFVHHVNGVPDFRVTDPNAFDRACTYNWCWVCGKAMGRFCAFVGGPLIAGQGIAPEPPSHRDCAIFAAQVCPFLLMPRSQRREVDLPANRAMGGVHVAENPGIAAVSVARGYKLERTGSGYLFRFTVAEVLWFREGRPATAGEVREANVVALERFACEAAASPSTLNEMPKIAARLERYAADVPTASAA